VAFPKHNGILCWENDLKGNEFPRLEIEISDCIPHSIVNVKYVTKQRGAATIEKLIKTLRF